MPIADLGRVGSLPAAGDHFLKPTTSAWPWPCRRRWAGRYAGGRQAAWICHFWVAPPQQDQSWTFDVVVLTSRHRPDCTPRMVPSDWTVHFWLLPPVQL